MENHDIQHLEEFLPEWAIKYIGGASGERYLPGAQLCTKDGRRVGNAVIVSQGTANWSNDERENEIMFYQVLTDMGTEMTLTKAEMMELFHEPAYVMDIEEGVEARIKKLK